MIQIIFCYAMICCFRFVFYCCTRESLLSEIDWLISFLKNSKKLQLALTTSNSPDPGSRFFLAVLAASSLLVLDTNNIFYFDSDRQSCL